MFAYAAAVFVVVVVVVVWRVASTKYQTVDECGRFRSFDAEQKKRELPEKLFKMKLLYKPSVICKG